MIRTDRRRRVAQKAVSDPFLGFHDAGLLTIMTLQLLTAKYPTTKTARYAAGATSGVLHPLTNAGAPIRTYKDSQGSPISEAKDPL